MDKLRSLMGSGLLAALLLGIGLGGCASESDEELAPGGTGTGDFYDPAVEGKAPLVTMEHWKDSTAGERYAFLIGFVTMLELEKEWQGREGQGILSYEQSLVPRWVEGLAFRPLAEIYQGLNRHLLDYPGDLDRPVAEVMWFEFVQPEVDEKIND